MFAYCNNAPILLVDQNGAFAGVDDLFLVGLAAIAIVGVYSICLLSPQGQQIAQNFTNAVVYEAQTIISEIDATFESARDSILTSVKYKLPSLKKVTINMDHILSGHSAGGNRGPNKDRFPPWMTAKMIEKAIREAYKHAEKMGSMQFSWEKGVEVVKQLFRGPWDDGYIYFWFNYTTNTIETAYPKGA